MTGAVIYAGQWIFPGGSSNNKQAFEALVEFDPAVTPEEQMLLFDAQTSGGLLIAVPHTEMGVFEQEMVRRGASWWQIGSVKERGTTAIIVRR
jgi:selenide,water dikinase